MCEYFLVRVWEGKGVTGADLVGLRSPRALWDRNMHDSSRGGAEFRQFKLRHQPWALPLLGLGAVRESCPGSSDLRRNESGWGNK